MPMGVTNAPATFQRLMNEVLKAGLGRHMLLYVDNTIVNSKNFRDHQKHLSEVFTALRKAGITLKKSKCKIGTTQIDFLGRHVSGKGLQLQDGKFRKLDQMRDSTNISEVKSFLGFAGYYRRYVENFAKIAEPLVALTRKETEWLFGNKKREACHKLKVILTRAPLLAHFDPDEIQIQTTDASMSGLTSDGKTYEWSSSVKENDKIAFRMEDDAFCSTIPLTVYRPDGHLADHLTSKANEDDGSKRHPLVRLSIL
jgi:hypothetical protein